MSNKLLQVGYYVNCPACGSANRAGRITCRNCKVDLNTGQPLQARSTPQARAFLVITSFVMALILLSQDINVPPLNIGSTQSVINGAKLFLVVLALAQVVSAIGLGMKASWSYLSTVILDVVAFALGILFDIRVAAAFSNAISGSPSRSIGYFVLDYSFLFGYGIFYFIITVMPLFLLLTHKGLKQLLRPM